MCAFVAPLFKGKACVLQRWLLMLPARAVMTEHNVNVGCQLNLATHAERTLQQLQVM